MQGRFGLLVLALTGVLVTVSSASVNKCGPLKNALRQNQEVITIPSPENPVSGHTQNLSNVCGEETECCKDLQVSISLQKIALHDLEEKLKKRFEPTQRVFATLAQQITDELSRLWSSSENETLTHLLESGAPSGSSATRQFYSSLWERTVSGRASSDPPASFPRYLSSLFPEVYLGVVHVGGEATVGKEYRECLARHAEGRLGAGGDRVRTSAVDRAAGVLSLVNRVARGVPPPSVIPPSCSPPLTRLTGCRLCSPLSPTPRPCVNFCLNVYRGCLAPLDEVSGSWVDFLEEGSKFLKDVLRDRELAVENFLQSVPAAVSDALIVARVEGPSIEKEMKRLCGGLKPSNTSRSGGGATASTRPQADPPAAGVTPPASGSTLAKRLREALAALDEAKGLFAGLSEAFCSPDVEERGDKHPSAKEGDCWNGYKVGEYTKPLVRPEVDSQKYNPEVAWLEPPVKLPSVQQMIDNLRHMRKTMVELTNVSKRPAIDSLIEEQGSGSGGGPYRQGDDEDDYAWAGSGSGERPTYHGEEDDSVHGRSGYPVNRGYKPPLNSPDLTNLLTPDDERESGAPPRTSGTSSHLVASFLATLVTATAALL